MLAVISYLMDTDKYYNYYAELPAFRNGIFITGLMVLLSFVVNRFLLRKEDSQDAMTIRGYKLFTNGQVVHLFTLAIILLSFSIPYLELNHQLDGFTSMYPTDSIREVSLATYTIVFIACTALIFRDRITRFKFNLYLIAVILYATVYTMKTMNLRSDIFLSGYVPSGYFLIHLLSLPAAGYLVYVLIRNLKALQQKYFVPLCWVLLISSAVILSIELDHTVIWMLSAPGTYHTLLYDVHTFGYPILWGVIAMILMIWGLKKKQVTLRKISLVSFALILIKFYAYDVWLMTQTGRIISFVVLGIILLTVSFMQQKIKVLVQDNDVTTGQDERPQQ